jgi:hypothetical protein
VAAQQGWLALSAKNWAFQVLFPSFVPALAIFVTVLIGVAMMRRNSTPPTADPDPLSRILIAGPFVVALWLGGFYVLRSMIETKAYRRLSLVGAHAYLEDDGATLVTDVRMDRVSLIPGLFYGMEGMRIGGTRELAFLPRSLLVRAGSPIAFRRMR